MKFFLQMIVNLIQLYKRGWYKNTDHEREKGLSQDTLAKLTGYTDRSSITKIEKGQVDLQQSKIELFAKALGTTSRELVGCSTLQKGVV